MKRLTDKDALTAKILAAIFEESVRLSKTVGDFLDYARPKPPKLDPVDLAQVLDQALAFLEQRCRELKVEVVRDYAHGLTVLGDKDLLYRALYNVLANAMEAVTSLPEEPDEPVRGQIVIDPVAASADRRHGVDHYLPRAGDLCNVWRDAQHDGSATGRNAAGAARGPDGTADLDAV